MKIRNLETVLPILGFNENVLVSNNLDLTIGFKLQLPEVLSCSTEQLYMLHDTFQRMINLLQELKGTVTILLVEHDMDAVFALADRITVMVYGKIIASGAPEDIKNNADVRIAYLGQTV